jgi:tetratricopeptide (TPR) repeat protein
MAAWHSFELTKDYTALTKSIAKFRETICEDSGFAMAQYRLARALTADGQPGAAVIAYRSSLQAYPDFVAGHIALADTLFNFDDYCYYTPPAVSAGNDSSKESELAATMSDCAPEHDSASPKANDAANPRKHGRQNEAIGLWRRVIRDLSGDASVSDQAAAYAGLCHAVPQEDRFNEEQKLRYAAFFFCKRAEYLYSKLPPNLRTDGQIKAARASALDQIGEILSTTPAVSVVFNTRSDHPKLGEKPMICDGPDKDAGETKTQLTLYGPYAVKYYQEALAILPEDREAKCYLAIHSWLLGEPRPMQDLDLDADMHHKRGDDLWRKANKQKISDNYRKAIEEYSEAIKLDPANTEAMNDYANAFWDWRVRFPQDPPSTDIAVQAEHFAQVASDMTRVASTTAHSTDAATSTMTHLIDAATVLEVYLGEGRADLALGVLPRREHPFPDHAYFNDVRWDLAQAYLCAAADARQAHVSFHQRYDPQAEARKLFQEILNLEKTRGTRPFTDAAKKILNDKVCLLRQPVGPEMSPNQRILRSESTEKDPQKARGFRQVAEGLKENR